MNRLQRSETNQKVWSGLISVHYERQLDHVIPFNQLGSFDTRISLWSADNCAWMKRTIVINGCQSEKSLETPGTNDDSYLRWQSSLANRVSDTVEQCRKRWNEWLYSFVRNDQSNAPKDNSGLEDNFLSSFSIFDPFQSNRQGQIKSGLNWYRSRVCSPVRELKQRKFFFLFVIVFRLTNQFFHENRRIRRFENDQRFEHLR